MKFRVAAIQMLATDDKAANLGQAAQFVRDAAAQGASVVALPEVFLWRGDKTKERQIAERIPGPSPPRAGVSRAAWAFRGVSLAPSPLPSG